MNAPRITIDFETRSAQSIDVGAWLYAQHPTTEVLCLAYRLPDGTRGLWRPAFPHLGIVGDPAPADLLGAIADGLLVEAHNRFFEYCIWRFIMGPRYSWPAVGHGQWRCSAAKAAYYGLPRSLDGAVRALGLPIEKDMEGNRLMKRMSKPRKPTKEERAKMLASGEGDRLLWHESPALLERLWDYCRTDVDAEHCFSESLPDLPESELRIWQMDQDMNERGMRCDLGMVRSAMRMRDREVRAMNAELADIMGLPEEERGEFSATRREAVRSWICEQGVELPDTQALTLDKFAARGGMRPDVAAALSILREVNRTSTAKYDAMLERADPADGRLRDLMMYHGAGTGRWAGKGVQPHNFPRGAVKDMEAACRLIVDEDAGAIRALHGEVMEHLSHCLRGALTASPGRVLYVADFAAIEARVVMWLARQMDAMQVFIDESQDKGHGIYCDMATEIYGRPITKRDKDERQFGKQAILGLGFGMGFVTFLLTCKVKYGMSFPRAMCLEIVGSRYAEMEAYVEKYFLTDRRRIQRMRNAELSIRGCMHELVLMLYAVTKYRGRYVEVRQMWTDQEEAAAQAVLSPGRLVKCERGRNSWVVERIAGRLCLVTRLPSGKPLFYWDPALVLRRTPFRNADGTPVLKRAITFWGVDPYTKKWSQQDTYGGKLVENITQATARDLMALAMVRADDRPEYDVLLSVHDELICEADEGAGDVGEFERLMAETPGWAAGFPVDAEGWSGFRYRK